MLDNIDYETEITLEDIPLQWTSRIELFYPDLLGYPIMYVHKIIEEQRIFGFPVALSTTDINTINKTCSLKFTFLSNIELTPSYKNIIKLELENRIGYSDKFDLALIKSSCKGNKEYENFFEELWKYTEKIYGSYLPYGQLYEEIFSIVRFVSAFSPKTGRQSEMRMLYNFMSIFGESIELNSKWDCYEFYLLPTYEELLRNDFDDFTKFKNLFDAMKKIFNNNYSKTFSINGENIHYIPSGNSLGSSKDQFINKMDDLIQKKIITINDKYILERLVDAFNRLPTRAAFFISSIMLAFDYDYNKWDKNFFIKFYEESDKSSRVGISPKVIACFLQQGFKNKDVIPIDTWIDTFYSYPLSISNRQTFFESFDNLGKIERMIWFASQANKTNIIKFFDMLWCQRFGINQNKNNQLRENNPLSCYECNLKNYCVGYKDISNKKVFIYENVDINCIIPPSVQETASKRKCLFICHTVNKIPKRIYKINTEKNFYLIDEFSGYLINKPARVRNSCLYTVERFINLLPHYEPQYRL